MWASVHMIQQDKAQIKEEKEETRDEQFSEIKKTMKKGAKSRNEKKCETIGKAKARKSFKHLLQCSVA